MFSARWEVGGVRPTHTRGVVKLDFTFSTQYIFVVITHGTPPTSPPHLLVMSSVLTAASDVLVKMREFVGRYSRFTSQTSAVILCGN